MRFSSQRCGFVIDRNLKLICILQLLFRSLAITMCVPAGVWAQAWLFPKGQGSVTTSYQAIVVRNHAFAHGEAVDVGHGLSHTGIAEVDYSVTSKLAVRLGLPFVLGRYHGSSPHLPSDRTTLDNGAYHSTFQDFSADVRYNVSKRAVMLTPFFKVVVPSHNYEYFAHSAAGKRLHEYHLGASIGSRLEPVLSEVYVQARYSYAFVERTLGISPNRSDSEFQIGYFINPRLSLLGTTQWTHTHRGVECRYAFHCALPDDQWAHHDQIVKANLLEAGGGAVYGASPSLDVFASVSRSIAGRNSHLHAAVLTIGVSRTFGSGLRTKDASAWAGAPVPAKALVCTCARAR